MPIEDAQIPVLIKNSLEHPLDVWKKEYFCKIATNLQVHTKGQLFSKVDTLYPNEHPSSKAHCVATYEPVTKSSIWKGINNLSRIFSNSAFTMNVGQQLNDWLNDYMHDGSNLVTYMLMLWIHKTVAEDPNGLFVVYPPDWAEANDMCPLQFVRSDMIKSIGKTPDGIDYVDFVSEEQSLVQYYVDNIVTSKETFYDESIKGLNSRSITKTTYNEKLSVKVVKEVRHLFTRDGFIIYQPNANVGDDQKYQVVDFPDPLTSVPVFPGGGLIADHADCPIYESFVSPFVPFGNLCLIQHRSHRAVDLQFSYPRMAELQMPCDAGCVAGKIKVKTAITECTKCKGSGFVTVQSPYKTYSRAYNPNDDGDNKHLTIPPVEFFSPDVGIIDYSKDAWKDYLKMAEEAIFVTQKVYTGNVQSEESKRIDLDDLFAWLLTASRTFYNNLRMMLQCLEEYISPNPIKVSVEKPYSFAILTEEEAFIALNNLLESDAPVFVKANQVDNFVNKFISKSSPIVRALEILKKYDVLLFYATKDIQTFKGANTITGEMWTKHILAFPTLLRLYQQDATIFEQEDQAIMDTIDKEIKALNINAAGTGSLADQLRRQVTEPVIPAT